MSVPVILDVDTGVDDALAILFAVRHPGIDVLGISGVAGNAPLAQVIVLDAGVPCYMYGLDVFNHVAIEHGVAVALERGDDQLGRVVGALLGNRVALSEDESAEYTGLIGDAGAVCSIVDPGALRTEVRPVRVELAGYGRGQTLVDLRRFPGEDVVHGLADEWTEVEIALEVDASRMSRLFLETLGLGASARSAGAP